MSSSEPPSLLTISYPAYSEHLPIITLVGIILVGLYIMIISGVLIIRKCLGHYRIQLCPESPCTKMDCNCNSCQAKLTRIAGIVNCQIPSLNELMTDTCNSVKRNCNCNTPTCGYYCQQLRGRCLRTCCHCPSCDCTCKAPECKEVNCGCFSIKFN